MPGGRLTPRAPGRARLTKSPTFGTRFGTRSDPRSDGRVRPVDLPPPSVSVSPTFGSTARTRIAPRGRARAFFRNPQANPQHPARGALQAGMIATGGALGAALGGPPGAVLGATAGGALGTQLPAIQERQREAAMASSRGSVMPAGESRRSDSVMPPGETTPRDCVLGPCRSEELKQGKVTIPIPKNIGKAATALLPHCCGGAGAAPPPGRSRLANPCGCVMNPCGCGARPTSPAPNPFGTGTGTPATRQQYRRFAQHRNPFGTGTGTAASAEQYDVFRAQAENPRAAVARRQARAGSPRRQVSAGPWGGCKTDADCSGSTKYCWPNDGSCREIQPWPGAGQRPSGGVIATGPYSRRMRNPFQNPFDIRCDETAGQLVCDIDARIHDSRLTFTKMRGAPVSNPAQHVPQGWAPWGGR